MTTLLFSTNSVMYTFSYVKASKNKTGLKIGFVQLLTMEAAVMVVFITRTGETIKIRLKPYSIDVRSWEGNPGIVKHISLLRATLS